MQKLISESFAELHYDETLPCFVIRWIGFQKLEFTQPFCEKVVQTLSEIRIKNPKLTSFIGNTLHLEVLTPEIQNYWDKIWNPAMYNAGGRFLALIVPTSVFAQFSVEQYSDVMTEKLQEVKVRMFDDIEKAKEWLKTCQN
ncbi:MAG: hypothetical protein EAZ85_01945 [Bacteroidetes bacterium]|nr:MAG: hypothetical protein EAZ85_01945 [Bacteroidota bacterium]